MGVNKAKIGFDLMQIIWKYIVWHSLSSHTLANPQKLTECTYLKDMAEELGIVVWPVRSTNQNQDLDELVADERREGGGMREKVLHEEVTKLCSLCELQGQPHVGG